MTSSSRRTRVSGWCLALYLIIPGCERAPDEGGETVLQPAPLFSVGEWGGDVEFGTIRDLAVGSRNEVVVLDGMSQQLTVADSTGKVLRTIGREGKGPGEIGAGAAVGVLSDGSVAVLDVGNRRVTLFSPDGEYRDDWPISVPPVRASPVSLLILEGDRIALALRPRYDAEGSAIWPRALYEVRTTDGVVSDTIWGAASHASGCGTSHARFWAGMFEDFRSMYRGVVRWTLTAGGALVIGCSSSTDLTVERGDGTVPVSVPPRPPIERTAGEIEWFEMGLRARGATSDVPSTHPPISGLLPTADGRFLVVAAYRWHGRLIPEEDRPPGAPIHTWEREKAGDVFLFDAGTGDYVATLPLPDEAQYRPHWPYAPPVIRGDRMWLVLVDPTSGVQSVGVFGLR